MALLLIFSVFLSKNAFFPVNLSYLVCRWLTYILISKRVYAIANLCDIEVSLDACLLKIGSTYFFDEGWDSLVANRRNGTSTETATRHARADDAIYLPCFFCERIQVQARNFIIVAERYMRCVHELTELR